MQPSGSKCGTVRRCRVHGASGADVAQCDADGGFLGGLPHHHQRFLHQPNRWNRVVLRTHFRARYPGKTNNALTAMRAAMPGVEIIEVPSENVITFGGALHCLVKTVPIEEWPDPCDDVRIQR